MHKRNLERATTLVKVAATVRLLNAESPRMIK